MVSEAVLRLDQKYFFVKLQNNVNIKTTLMRQYLFDRL